jgi:hypothetical protein
MRETTASVPDIGRSLRLAREQARLSTLEAADRIGLSRADVETLESGTVARMRDRVETLRALRAYANSLGLPGNDYVLAVLDLWPNADQSLTRIHDSGQVPVVSVTSAPVGGHSPISDGLTGVADFSVTGVVSPLGANGAPLEGAALAEALRQGELAPANGVDHEPDTGELPRVRQSAPRALKVMVGLAAVLVAAGVFTLLEHSNFSAWHKDLSADTTRWVKDVKQATGLSPKPKATAAAAPGALPKVVMKPDDANSRVAVNVDASSFSVKVVAFKAASWIQVTDSSQQAPIFQQVLASGANMTFPVTHAITIETGSPSARAYIYEGSTFIGFYFPDKAPFTMTFNATG